VGAIVYPTWVSNASFVIEAADVFTAIVGIIVLRDSALTIFFVTDEGDSINLCLGFLGAAVITSSSDFSVSASSMGRIPT
jgi:hypothetical protein